MSCSTAKHVSVDLTIYIRYIIYVYILRISGQDCDGKLGQTSDMNQSKNPNILKNYLFKPARCIEQSLKIQQQQYVKKVVPTFFQTGPIPN